MNISTVLLLAHLVVGIVISARLAPQLNFSRPVQYLGAVVIAALWLPLLIGAQVVRCIALKRAIAHLQRW